MAGSGIALSVIVPVFNGAAMLRRCLDAIFASQGATFEVVVVDDGSTDASAAIARSFPCRVLELPENRGAAAARNRGAEAAVHDILVFIDADMFVHQGALAEIARCFEADPGLGALGGTDVPDDGETRWGPALLGLFYHFSIGWKEGETFKDTNGFQSDLGAVRRDLFRAAGGFDERFVGSGVEEYDLGHRLRRIGSIRLVRNVTAHHQYAGLSRRIRTVFRRSVVYATFFRRERAFEGAGQTPTRDNAVACAVACAIPASIVLLPWSPGAVPAVAGVAVGAWLLTLRGFLAFAARRRGRVFAAWAAVALLPVFWAAGLGFAASMAGCFWKYPALKGNHGAMGAPTDPPDPDGDLQVQPEV